MDVKTINNIEKAPTAKPGKLSHKKKKNVFECQKKNTGASTPYLLFRLDVQSTRVRRRDLAEYQNLEYRRMHHLCVYLDWNLYNTGISS